MLNPMSTRRTTAQISAQLLSRLKEVAKEKNLPLYALLDEVVNEYLKSNSKNPKNKQSLNSPEKQVLFRQLFATKPLTGKNKWFTTGIGAVGWAIYTLLAD